MSTRVVTSTTATPARRPRGPFALALIAITLLAMFVGLIALGTWQVQRRAWKLDLIERVDARVHAAPVSPPAPRDWPTVSTARDEYRHVSITGRFVDAEDTRVQAVTELGAGFWLLRPLRQADGSIVLVNRGFVPGGWTPDRDTMPHDAETTVTGLLRLSEPRGGFLRRNAPADDRWYSRDVAAIAAARGLRHVAPYFIDADAARASPVSPAGAGAAPQPPVGGLTVVRFRNSHLVYALTWYGLALLVAYAGWRVAREERRLRTSRTGGGDVAHGTPGTHEDARTDAGHSPTRRQRTA